jgi:hypothetical protein
MERHFFIEAKSFCFLAKEGLLDFRLEEKRKGFVGAIFVSRPASSWLVDSVEAACLLPVKEDFAKSYREDFCTFFYIYILPYQKNLPGSLNTMN